MTIALGALCPNGVILGADTEETIGTTKTEALKVSTGISFGLHGSHPSAIGITGAGDSWYLEYLFEELVGYFRDNGSLAIKQLGVEFRKIIRTFYADHVTPFLVSEPELALTRIVIGAQRNNETSLWVSARNTLRTSHGYEAVGIGSIEAQRSLRRTIGLRHTMESALITACYAIQQAKESSVSCGKNTVLLCITNNSARHIYPDVIEKAEKLFRKYEGQEYSSFMYAIGQPFSDESKHLEKLGKWSQELREEFKQLALQMLKD